MDLPPIASSDERLIDTQGCWFCIRMGLSHRPVTRRSMASNDHVKTHRRAEGNAVIVSGAARLAGRRSGILLGHEKEIL